MGAGGEGEGRYGLARKAVNKDGLERKAVNKGSSSIGMKYLKYPPCIHQEEKKENT